MIEWGVVVGVVLRRRCSRSCGRGSSRCSPTTPPSRTSPSQVLWIVAALQPLNAVVFVLDGILIGAGDARYLAAAMARRHRSACSSPAAVAVLALDGGLLWLWAALCRSGGRPPRRHGRSASSGRPLAGHRRGARSRLIRDEPVCNRRGPGPRVSSVRCPTSRSRQSPAVDRRRRETHARRRVDRRRRRPAAPSTELVPVPAATRARTSDVEHPPGRRRRAGAAASASATVARTIYDPMYRHWFRAEWEGLEHIPRDGRRAARRQPRRRDPVRRARDHARHRDRAPAARLRARREPLPRAARARHALVALRRRARAPRQRVPAPARRQAARARLPRGHQGHGQALPRPLQAPPLRPRRLRRDRDARRRAGRPDRGRRRRGVDADRLEEPAAREAAQRPVRPPDRQHAAVRARRASSSTSRRSSSSGCSRRCTSTSRPTRSATPAAGSWTRPSTSASGSRTRSTTCCGHAAASGRADAVRVLVTGLGTFWGSRLAQSSRARTTSRSSSASTPTDRACRSNAPSSCGPTRRYSILQRIVQATQVDTILHTHLVVDSTKLSGRALHEINVIGTMNLLAAAGAAGSPVRKVVVKSSTLVYGSNYQDPYFFREEIAPYRGRPAPGSNGRCSRSRVVRARLRRGQPARRS